MANIDRTKREVPYSGEDRPTFQRRMGEYRRRRNVLNKAAAAARRRGDAPTYNALLDSGAKRGIQVGGTDSVERMRQMVLGQMDREEERAIENEKLKQQLEALDKRPNPKLGGDRPDEEVTVAPTDSKEQNQMSYVDQPVSQYGIIPDPYRNEDSNENLFNFTA